MKRLDYLNLIGVLALAALCVAQWRRDRQLNLEINQLENVRLQQEAKIVEQERSMHGLDEDLVHFKEQFLKAETATTESGQKLRAAEREIRQLTLERDQLKGSINNWASAVTARDERLTEANAQIRRLADELNASIRKFNELATNYNATVKDLNDLRSRVAQPKPASQ